MKIIKDKKLNYFILFSFVYCTLCALIFQPITWQAQGDAGAYIELAKQFLGTSTQSIDLSYRQPLYSFLIAPFIYIFGENGFIYPVIYLQFFMIFISSILVFKIFELLNLFRYLPAIAGGLYLINFSTLHFGYTLISETLALFIFVSVVYFLMISIDKKKVWIYLSLGVLNGFVVLVRFNMIGIPIVILLCLMFIHYRQHRFKKLKEFLLPSITYVISLLFIINLWCLYNYSHRGFYGIFPSYHAGQRWAIPATINETNQVSEEFQPLLDIFIKARKEYFEKKPTIQINKGSLLEHKIFRDFYLSLLPDVNGRAIYLLAENDLLKYYGLNHSSESISKLGSLIKPFFNEIAAQNEAELFQLRIYSLLRTFKASGGTLPINLSLNLNVLPGIIFKVYKILFLVISVLTYIFSAFYFLLNIFKLKSFNHWKILLLILLIWYFPAVHFYANVLGDANRFKFPVEPLIIGIATYYIFSSFNKKMSRKKTE